MKFACNNEKKQTHISTSYINNPLTPYTQETFILEKVNSWVIVLRNLKYTDTLIEEFLGQSGLNHIHGWKFRPGTTT